MNKNDELPNDNREKGEYESRYKNKECQKKIKRDALYISALLIGSIVCILLNFLNVFENILNLSGDKAVIFHKAMYCVISGLLGGSTFGMKYFYRVVARGLWNEDRVYWRIFSPWIAVSLSIVMAAIMIKDVTASSALAITIGFLTGYFSDEAVSKMYDVACVLFLKSDGAGSRKEDEIDCKIKKDREQDNETIDSEKK